MKFNGYLKLRIGEAVDLKPTTFSLRHSVIYKKGPPALDPYIVVKVDDYKIGQTHIKQKTNTPTYNEEFCLNVMNGKQIEMAVFHDTPIGYDDFVANCVVQFEDLIKTSNTGESFEGWVSTKWMKLLCKPWQPTHFCNTGRIDLLKTPGARVHCPPPPSHPFLPV